MRPRLPKVWVDVIEDDQIGRPMQIYRTDCLSLKRNVMFGRLLKIAGHLPNSNWTEIIQYGVPYRAQHERHQHREKVVEEYHKEVNDALDCLRIQLTVKKIRVTKSCNNLSINS